MWGFHGDDSSRCILVCYHYCLHIQVRVKKERANRCLWNSSYWGSHIFLYPETYHSKRKWKHPSRRRSPKRWSMYTGKFLSWLNCLWIISFKVSTAISSHFLLPIYENLIPLNHSYKNCNNISIRINHWYN